MIILCHIRSPLLTLIFISVAFSPRSVGIRMHFQTLLSPLLKVPRMVLLLSSLLWWELGTSLPGHGPGEWLSFWQVPVRQKNIYIVWFGSPDPAYDYSTILFFFQFLTFFFFAERLAYSLENNKVPAFSHLDFWYSVWPVSRRFVPCSSLLCFSYLRSPKVSAVSPEYNLARCFSKTTIINPERCNVLSYGRIVNLCCENMKE